ncbi:2TM domain-containing protein [Hymenobacter daecheongensis DSM 21074]|uniref:2TM domain-containing protein n=1 Tax=Hymenobacter daecheongensis DSM 21074 TaxID=1121955 RepID=A0A1M6GUM3_9BACT|nr:2TM domain-containing protein [Hymenobacter daecheongensis]SHJ13621.1 2TM domain-containing protein [Hymenobacter daecheongensis DSM 21074]
MEAASTNRDPELWRTAKARAKFKSHLFTYLAVNTLLWVIWALTNSYTGWQGHGRHINIPWPIWPTVFWGFGVLMNGIRVYSSFGSQLSEREYERLVRERDGR